MPTLAKYKNTLIAIVAFCVLYLAYAVLWPMLGFSDAPILEQVATNPQSAQSAKIIEALGKVEKIKFDTAFLDAPEFTSLVDYTEEINKSAEPIVRPNPFAEIGR